MLISSLKTLYPPAVGFFTRWEWNLCHGRWRRVVFACVCALPDQACWSRGVPREWAQVTGGHPAKSGITFRLGVGCEEEREKLQRLRGDGQQWGVEGLWACGAEKCHPELVRAGQLGDRGQRLLGRGRGHGTVSPGKAAFLVWTGVWRRLVWKEQGRGGTERQDPQLPEAGRSWGASWLSWWKDWQILWGMGA